MHVGDGGYAARDLGDGLGPGNRLPLTGAARADALQGPMHARRVIHDLGRVGGLGADITLADGMRWIAAHGADPALIERHHQATLLHAATAGDALFNRTDGYRHRCAPA
jgi:hypothetical protein